MYYFKFNMGEGGVIKMKKKSSISYSNHRFFTRRSILRFLQKAAGMFILAKAAKSDLLAGTEEKLKPRKKRKITTLHDLVAVKGDSPFHLTMRALQELGGIGRFVRKSDVVVVKPNIGWNRSPEFAANTNPEVVAALVTAALQAGAKTVKVFDNTCNSAKMCYHTSGIYDAVKKAGGEIQYVSDWKYIPGEFPPGSAMADWPINRDAVECDCFINVPVAKHHSLTDLTLSIKNLMGVCGGMRGLIHLNIEKKLVELAGFISPDLTIIDAYRILMKNGPSGGNRNDVVEKKTIIASADPVLADSYAATLFNKDPGSIGYIRIGAEKKLGSMDLSSARIKKIKI